MTQKQIKPGARVVFWSTGARGTVETVENGAALVDWDNGAPHIAQLADLDPVDDNATISANSRAYDRLRDGA